MDVRRKHCPGIIKPRRATDPCFHPSILQYTTVLAVALTGHRGKIELPCKVISGTETRVAGQYDAAPMRPHFEGWSPGRFIESRACLNGRWQSRDSGSSEFKRYRSLNVLIRLRSNFRSTKTV